MTKVQRLVLAWATVASAFGGADARKGHSPATTLLHPEIFSAIGESEAARRANSRHMETTQFRGEGLNARSMIQEWVAQSHQTSERRPGSIPEFSAIHESEWNYAQHGADWTQGKCKSGNRQSPVDLHIEGLAEPEYKNMTDIYLHAFSGGQLGRVARTKPWKKGDFFYSYPNQMSDVLLYKSDKVFQVRSASQGLVPLGALFPSDTAEMFLAHQILFHSPSEHTFQGEANRREIEMQIWHYSNDLLSVQASKSVGSTTLPYLALFAQSSLSLPEVENAITETAHGGTDPNLASSHWRVISLTFMSEELDQASLEELRSLPSERMLRSLLHAEAREATSSAEGEVLALPHPLNLQALMMMLQLTNVEFFAYDGSHTLPGCEENVRWYVARQPLPVATDTMLRFYKMLNPRKLTSEKEKDGNFRMLQNIEGNMKNDGDVFLVQGFPLQVLIADSLGLTNLSDAAEVSAAEFKGWFRESSAWHSTPTAISFACLAVLLSLSSFFGVGI